MDPTVLLDSGKLLLLFQAENQRSVFTNVFWWKNSNACRLSAALNWVTTWWWPKKGVIFFQFSRGIAPQIPSWVLSLASADFFFCFVSFCLVVFYLFVALSMCV